MRGGHPRMGIPESVGDALSRSELLRSILPLAAAAGSFRLGAAAAVINQPRLPPIFAGVGTYEHVGVRYANVGGARVKCFYPAAGPSPVMAPYLTDGRTTSDGMAGLVGFRQLGLSFLLAHLANAPSGCWLDAPPVASSLPLLVYSHGFGGNMDMSTYLFRAFAAAGVNVAAVEHTDGTASYTELADRTPLPFSPGALSPSEQLTRRATELLAAATPGALGPEGSLPLATNADVFIGGHSYGGPAALLAAALSSSATSSAPSSLLSPSRPPINLKGLLLHDPALGMALGGPSRARVPTLSYVSDEYDAAGVRCGDVTLHTKGGFHGNFVDAPLWAPAWVMRPLSAVIPAAGPADPVAMHATLAKTAKIFMTRASASGTVPTAELLAAGGTGSLPRAGASAASATGLLELRGGACFSAAAAPPGGTGDASPSELLMQWRNERLARFAASFDGSRYHAQVRAMPRASCTCPVSAALPTQSPRTRV